MSILKNFGEEIPITISAAALIGLIGTSISMNNRMKRLEDYVYNRQESAMSSYSVRLNDVEDNLGILIPLIDPHSKQKVTKTIACLNDLGARMSRLEDNRVKGNNNGNSPPEFNQNKKPTGYKRITSNNNEDAQQNIDDRKFKIMSKGSNDEVYTDYKKENNNKVETPKVRQMTPYKKPVNQSSRKIKLDSDDDEDDHPIEDKKNIKSKIADLDDIDLQEIDDAIDLMN